MLKLTLFRHAKSAWDDPHIEDFDRPLSERGAKAAPRMGAYMSANGMRPDLVLSSPSARTRATCALAFAEFPVPPPIRFEKDLYLASAATILGFLQDLSGSVRHVMIVGHNPGLQDLALQFAEGGPKELIARLELKFPTAAVVEINLRANGWRKIGPKSGAVVAFTTPSDLEKK